MVRARREVPVMWRILGKDCCRWQGDRSSTRNARGFDGLTVMPGFVDVHTHYDAQILWDPLLTSSCWHGVTTVVMGNCGLALAPCRPEHREFLRYLFSRVEAVPADALDRRRTLGMGEFSRIHGRS